MTEQIDPSFRGSLLIYVDGYGVDAFHCAELNLGHKFSQPKPDEMNWYLNGWAVGSNARDRYCSRNAKDKIRRFRSYDVAVEYISKKRKKRPREVFSLVYEVDGRARKVSFLDDILAIDAEIDADKQSRKENFIHQFPAFDALSEKVGRVVAFKASELLRMLHNGEDEAARAQFSIATYYRLKGILRDAGLISE